MQTLSCILKSNGPNGGTLRGFARVVIAALLAGAAMLCVLAGIASAAATYVQRGGFKDYLRHPAVLSFSVDGDLEGIGLHWKHWGGGFTVSHGKIYERQGYPSYTSRSVPGAIKLDQVRWCRGSRYYTHAVFYPYGPLLFKAGPVHLITPCNGG